MNLEFDVDQDSLIADAQKVFEQLDTISRYRRDEVASIWTELVRGDWSELGEALESGSLDLGAALGIFRAAGSQLIIEDLTTSAYLLQALFVHITESKELFKGALRTRPGVILGDNRAVRLDLSGPDHGLVLTSADEPAIFRLVAEGKGRPRLGLAVKAKVEMCRVGEGLSYTTKLFDVSDATWVFASLDLERSELEGIVRTAALLHSAARIGAAERAIEMTRQYTLGREQFGVPIGSFQAVKHLLADALAAKEVAWSAVLCAAATPSQGAYGNLVARWLSLEAAMQASRVAAQLHGGIGFTWESDLHFVLKTILDSSTRFGSTTSLAIAIADLFLEQNAVAE